ncbi:MAG: FAD-binding oxidoreductase [Actinomycetota bacterium]
MYLDRSSYMFDMVLFELRDIVGRDSVSVRDSDKLTYSVDYYWISELWHDRSDSIPTADFIVHPQNSGQVSRILVLANEYKIPVTVWGGGGGSQGGALAVFGGIIMDMKKMNRVLEIDKKSMTVEAETGILMQNLEWELEKHGLSTMHIPASIFCSTLGGFLAHRGTGVLSTKYGKMEDMVVSMEVVLPTGEIIESLPVNKTASGPDLNWIFIGSEGTLGVITRVKVTVKKMPEVRKFQAFLYEDLASGLEAGRNLMHEGIKPSVIRLYDAEETNSLLKRVMGVDREGAYLVYGIDGYKDVAELQAKHAYRIASKGGEDLGTETGKDWWDSRYKFFYPPYYFSIPQAFGTCDTVATYKNIEAVYWGMKNSVAEKFPQARFIGHFSHWFDWGCMLYARFIIDNPPADKHEAVDMYNDVWNTVIRAAVKEGGVLNEHHGIGLKLGRLMKEQYGPSFKIIKDLKKMLDPNHIMNPGKMGLGVK